MRRGLKLQLIKLALSLKAALLYEIMRASIEVQESCITLRNIMRASIEVQEYRSTVRILGDDKSSWVKEK